MRPKINMDRTKTIKTTSTSKTVVMACGPVKAKICPINQGRNMLPAPEPTRNQPVIAPVICIRSPASRMNVGNMDAMERPSPKVPIQRAVFESFQSIMTMVLMAQPKISMNRIVTGRRRVDTHTPTNLPKVNDPQKAEVRYAAVISVSRLRVRA